MSPFAHLRSQLVKLPAIAPQLVQVLLCQMVQRSYDRTVGRMRQEH
jgi:hypothetical protein